MKFKRHIALTVLIAATLLCARVSTADRSTEPHWAYVKPTRPALPDVDKTSWPQNAIDHFVLARLNRENLAPSPRADRAKLLRRVYLDLIGLPPSPKQVDAFLADQSPDALAKVVDQLLASPRYGEKWARHWLDLARYADSNGFQADQLRDSWAYRDWVIAAMNADMPFDQFTIEQIAGDLLPDPTVDQKIATGFHRTVTCNVEAGVDPEANRVNQIFDRVNTTGTVWLGTTFECTQCHDHKYDPFTMRDYYSMFAYFNNTPIEVKSTDNRMVSYDFYGPTMDLPLSPQREAQRERLQARLNQLSDEAKTLRAGLLNAMADWEKTGLDNASSKPSWHVMEVMDFTSSGGASHEVLEDQSVLVGGTRPDKDLYTVTVRTDVKNITGFKVETLTHPSLPANGPGRHDAPRPNFVCHEMTVGVRDDDSAEVFPVELHSAEADFSQDNWDVKGLIDGKPDTGWAINPQFGKPHDASVLTKKALNAEGRATTFVFTFSHQYGGGRNSGRLRLSARSGQRAEDGPPANIVKLLEKPRDKRSDKQQAQLVTFYLDQHDTWRNTQAEIDKTRKQLNNIKPDTTLVMVELDKPRQTHIMNRGDWQNLGDPVKPNTPGVLHDLTTPGKNADGNRLTLARWLVSKDNPLVARVTVNRWWAQFFGNGLVRTEEDFGTQGERPSHPGLLDWLAVEFMDSDWSMKHIHRTIVMSATYQQSSRISPDALQRDPKNRLLARGPRMRLSAEMIRDHALTASGLLVNALGGPPVYPPQPGGIWRHVGRNAPKYVIENDGDRFRRGIYVVWRRGAPYPSFVNFDAPDRASCVVQRARTNTPLQALTLMNDPAYVEMAMAMAGRILTEAPADDVASRATYGFRLATGREPNARELQAVSDLVTREKKQFESDPKLAEALINDIEGWKPPRDLSRVDLAAWFFAAHVLLNLDETITQD